MYITREECERYDTLMQELGVSKSNYTKMRAAWMSCLIHNTCPAHLTIDKWMDSIKGALMLMLEDDPAGLLSGQPPLLED